MENMFPSNMPGSWTYDPYAHSSNCCVQGTNLMFMPRSPMNPFGMSPPRPDRTLRLGRPPPGYLGWKEYDNDAKKYGEDPGVLIGQKDRMLQYSRFCVGLGPYLGPLPKSWFSTDRPNMELARYVGMHLDPDEDLDDDSDEDSDADLEDDYYKYL